MGSLRKEIPDEIFEQVLKDCIDKVDGINDDDWQDIVDRYELTCHRDVLRKGVAAPLSAYTVYNFMKEKMESSIDSNEILQEIEEKRLELEKEKVRFQDQRREYKKYLRQDARWEHLRDSIINEVKNIEKDLIVPYCRPIEGGKEAVLILSDWHIGSTSNNAWNIFNLDVAKRRVGELLDKTIKYCRLNNVATIHVELLGDLVSGYLHIGNRIENEEDVIKQVMIVSEMLCEFVVELSAHIPKVKVYTSTGNHGRCSANIKESMDVENFEKLIPWYMSARIKDDKIDFVENEVDNNIIIMRFLNEIIYCVHGHQDRYTNVVDNLSKMLKEFPTEIHLGHYHSFKESDEYDITTTVNGCLSGVDEYAKKIRKAGTPMQTLMIYNEDGRECTYKIKLK